MFDRTRQHVGMARYRKRWLWQVYLPCGIRGDYAVWKRHPNHVFMILLFHDELFGIG